MIKKNGLLHLKGGFVFSQQSFGAMQGNNNNVALLPTLRGCFSTFNTGGQEIYFREKERDCGG